VLGEECLVANGATVLDGARVGARSMIAAGAVVKPGDQIPDGVLAAGVPAVVKGPIAGTPSEFWVTANPPAYRALAARHREALRRVE
jgi:carbonic anhydrase/acetyltransferase-like protein (isoleucine patch superfamily)